MCNGKSVGQGIDQSVKRNKCVATHKKCRAGQICRGARSGLGEKYNVGQMCRDSSVGANPLSWVGANIMLRTGAGAKVKRASRHAKLRRPPVISSHIAERIVTVPCFA